MTSADLLALPARDLDAMVQRLLGKDVRRCPYHGREMVYIHYPGIGEGGGYDLREVPAIDGNVMLAILARLHALHPNWRVIIHMPATEFGKEQLGQVAVWEFSIGTHARVPFATVAEMPHAVAVAAVLAVEGVKS